MPSKDFLGVFDQVVGRRWNLARLVNQQVAEENDPTPL